MPFNSNMGFSPAGVALGLGQIPGITGTAGLGDAMETEEERRKRLGMVAQSRGQLTQQGSPATNALFGGLGGIGGTGRVL